MDICKHNDHCGGCLHQGKSYEWQLAWKEKQLRNFMKEYEVSCDHIEPIEGSPAAYRYRNKMEYTFGDMEIGGEMTLGMHQKKRYMSVVTVDECQLVDEDFNRILRATLDFCRERGYTKYHKKTHVGLMRHLIVRKGWHTHEILVNIVTSSEGDFDGEAWSGMIRDLPLDNTLVGVLHTVNDAVADTVSCDRMDILFGRDYYMEKIMGLDFKVSAFSFFQPNVGAVERLYTEALDLIDDFEGKDVLDLYCGAGTITQIMALRARHATGVEIVEEAVEAARMNAGLNGLDNCDFIAGDVLKVLQNSKEGNGPLSEKPDVIVFDPPRAGIHMKALDLIAAYGMEQLLYISCQPKTLCRDIKYLEAFGYHAVYLKPYDNFPMTRHVETVVLMSRVGE